ncbi:coiled-coil domain-containing protein 127a [Osmerus mordax]|uniref:coiled-coil domain-containing protein 127a n=1 Tax=Osmerus mordax TaxID=8014 RepID=UPI0035105875
MEERKQLQQEREFLEQEKRNVLESGAAGAVLRHSLDRESEWHRRASATLKELEGELVDRQSYYCSLILPKEQRLEMEKNLLILVLDAQEWNYLTITV